MQAVIVSMGCHTPRRDRGWEWKDLNLSAFIYLLLALFHGGFGGARSTRPFSIVMKMNRNTQDGIRRQRPGNTNQPSSLGDGRLRVADPGLPPGWEGIRDVGLV